MYIAGSRWQIEHKIIKFAPCGIGDELFQSVTCHSSPPEYGIVFTNKKTDGKDLHAVSLDRENEIASSDVLGIDFGVFDIEHRGSRRAEYVGIQQPDFIPLTG